MLRKLLVFSILLSIVQVTTGIKNADADMRSYVWSQEYSTLPKGEWELEFYLTTKLPDKQKSKSHTWEGQVELEYGVTDHFQAAIYQRYLYTNKKKDDDLEYTGTKVELKYRLFEKGDLPIDVLLYGEYKYNPKSSVENALEGKLVLSKDIGFLNLVYNQIIEQGVDRNGRTQHEYTAAISYDFFKKLNMNIPVKFAAESKGNYTAEKYAVGPSVQIVSDSWFFVIGALFGTNSHSTDIETRAIFGLLL